MNPFETPNHARTVFGTLLGTAVVAVTFVFAVVIWLSSEINDHARENSIALIDSALQSKFRRIATLTEDHAHRDDSYDVITNRDDNAALNVVGRGATLGAAFDFLFVTEPDGAPIYGYRTGGTASDTSFFDRNTTAEYVAAFAAGGVTNNAVLTGFTKVDGIVGLVAVTRVVPIGEYTSKPSDWPLMYGMLQLNDARLRLVAGDLIVDQMIIMGPRDTGRIDPDAGQLALKDRSGHTIATLVWQPPRPGDALFWQTMPPVLLVSLILVLANIYVGKITNRQSVAVRQARKLAQTDSLTGLLNTTGLENSVKTRELQVALDRGRVAALYLDLNGLKSLNDTLGHEAGNIALQVTAERLSASMRPTDFVARIGGDEFLCLLVDDAPAQAASQVADSILARTAPPIHFGDHEQQVRPSIGVALSDGNVSLDTLIARADMAMYHAKRQNIDQPIFFTEKIAHDKMVTERGQYRRTA